MANPYGIPDSEFNAIVASIKNRMDVVKKNADQDLEAGRGVSLINDRVVYYDPESDNKLYGITKHAAKKNEPVYIQSSGRYYREGMGFKAGVTFYVGTHGRVITDPTGLTNEQPLGTGIDESSIMINFGEDKGGNGTGVEADPVFVAHVASGITQADIDQWNAPEADPVFTGHVAYGITAGAITNWNTAYGFTQNFDLSGALHGDLLRYDSVSGKWKVSPASSLAPDWSAITGKPNSGNFIYNQNSSAQTANFWISGTGRLDDSLYLTHATPTINFFSSPGNYYLQRDTTFMVLKSSGGNIFLAGSGHYFETASGVVQTTIGVGSYMLDVAGSGKFSGRLAVGDVVSSYPTGTIVAYNAAGSGQVVAGTENFWTRISISPTTGRGLISWYNSSTITNVLNFNSSNIGVFTDTPASYMAGVDGVAVYGASYAGISLATATHFHLLYTRESTGALEIYQGGTGAVMQVYNGGNVGIGTSVNSGYQLDVNGTLRTTLGAYVGSLGVNTTSTTPGFVATVNGAIHIIHGMFVGADQAVRMVQEGGVNKIGSFSAATPLGIYEWGVERIRIFDGKIMMGYTSSLGNYTLQVNGAGYFSSNLHVENGYIWNRRAGFPGTFFTDTNLTNNTWGMYIHPTSILQFSVFTDSLSSTLDAMKLSPSGVLSTASNILAGGALFQTVADNETVDPDKIAVLSPNSGVYQIKYMTKAQLGIGGSVSAAGSNTEIQYNNSGAFGASPDFTYNGNYVQAQTTTLSNNGMIASHWRNISTWSSSPSFVSGAHVGATSSFFHATVNAAMSVNSGTIMSAQLIVNRIQGSGTITVNSGSSGVRAWSGNAVAMQFDTGTGTVTNVAAFQAFAPLPVGGTSATDMINITNYYGFLIAATDEYANMGAKIVNKWGVYQSGANDNNVFAAPLAIGHTNTPTAFVHVAAGTTARAQLRLVSGSAPSSPNDGDIWFDGTNMNIRIAGVTRTFNVT